MKKYLIGIDGERSNGSLFDNNYDSKKEELVANGYANKKEERIVEEYENRDWEEIEPIFVALEEIEVEDEHMLKCEVVKFALNNDIKFIDSVVVYEVVDKIDVKKLLKGGETIGN